jgi:pre-rRNA-processing protein TSR3
MSKEIKLFVYHANEDDPRKCSSRKLARFGFVKLDANIRRMPRDAVLLNPFAEKSLSREDLSIARRNGIIAVDCSWENAENSFEYLNKRNYSRALPFVVAANPVNYGKPFKLTTLEAFAASLYIFGERDRSMQILAIYKWGLHFLELNKEPLEEYRKAVNSREIVDIMKQYI